MRNRARNWAAALVAAVLVVALTSSGAAAQNDGCSAVLSQGKQLAMCGCYVAYSSWLGPQ